MNFLVSFESISGTFWMQFNSISTHFSPFQVHFIFISNFKFIFAVFVHFQNHLVAFLTPFRSLFCSICFNVYFRLIRSDIAWCFKAQHTLLSTTIQRKKWLGHGEHLLLIWHGLVASGWLFTTFGGQPLRSVTLHCYFFKHTCCAFISRFTIGNDCQSIWGQISIIFPFRFWEDEMRSIFMLICGSYL